jgi:hypothetical protein
MPCRGVLHAVSAQSPGSARGDGRHASLRQPDSVADVTELSIFTGDPEDIEESERLAPLPMQALLDNIDLLDFVVHDLAPVQACIAAGEGYWQLDGPRVSAEFEVEAGALRVIALEVLVPRESPEHRAVVDRIDALATRLGSTLYDHELIPVKREPS